MGKSSFHGVAEKILSSGSDLAQLKNELAKGFRKLANLHDQIATAFPGLAQGFVDNPQGAGVAAVSTPQPATFVVKAAAGISVLQVTNPQNRVPLTQQTAILQRQANPNPILGPIYHQFRSASNQAITANVQTYQPSTQTLHPFVDGNTWWQVRSSFDGKNFNDWSTPHQ